MFKKILDEINTMDKSIFKAVNLGIGGSLLICLISIILLLIYNTYYISPDLYTAGIILFKTSLTFAVSFFVCGIAIDTIKKQLQ